ncbi:hypothetical protein D9M73_45020 [compost metagenome]
MSSNELKNKWLTLGKTLPARAGEVVRSPKWRRRAVWSVGTVLVLWGLAYALVPMIVKSQVEKIASEKLGRQVTVGSVDFKPWSLELTVNELAIAKGDKNAAGASSAPGSAAVSAQDSPQLRIKRIYIDGELESLLRLAPVVGAIQVDDPVVSLTHFGDGRYDIDDILARLQPAADAPASDPPRFALYNLVLSNGQLDFNDQSVHKVHELRALNLSVPFLSNLKSQRDVKTAPHLAFLLNGSSFDTAAEGTPFAQTHKTDATFKLSGFDLTPYLGYLPASLPFKLQSAVLNADTKVSFEQTPATVVRVSGLVTADKVRLLDKLPGVTPSPAKPGKTTATLASHEVLAFDQLRITMDDVRPLEQFVKLSKVELTAPVLSVTRDRAGQFNLLPPGEQGATKSVAGRAHVQPATGLNDAKKEEKTAVVSGTASSAPVTPDASTAPKTPKVQAAAASAWKVQVASVAVRSGSVNWLDETLASPAQIRLADITLDASAIALPFAASAPLQFSGSLGLDAPAPAAVPTGKKGQARPEPVAATPARLSFGGTATDQAAQVTATVAAWPLNMAAKYIGQFLLPALGGQLDAQLGVNWKAAGGSDADKAQALQITAPQIALSDVLLAQGKVSLVSLKRVQVDGVDIDVPGQSFKAARMQLTQPKALVGRDADKRWMYERWMVGHGGAKTPPPTTAATKASAPSWAVAVNDVLLEGGALSFSDKAGAKPVAFEVSAVNAQLGGLVLDERPANKAQAAKLMPLTASLRLATGRFEPGKLSFKGNLGLAPIQAQGQLTADRLPVQAFEPYFSDAINIELLRADASFRGQVAYRDTPAGPHAQVRGNLAVEELKANTLAPSEDLLAWKALNLRGLNVALDPAKATRVDVRETVLTDFFARVIVTPEGRINLQDLLKPASSVATASGTASVTALKPPDATKTIAAPAAGTAAEALNDSKSAVAGTVSAVVASAATGPAPIINFGPVSLVNGKVLFSDHFVKPNYSANLSDLTGKLSAFSSVSTTGTPDMADLELRGRAEGTASLEILGKLNPLAKPLALDITGKVRDLELPPLSPYSVKYSGYGINRGKLSVDVKYLVQPDGRLTANNKVILNQLSFGDKVEGSTASLPVKLAVALLADRNGVIDIDLPISGSLNDPQFSLGPIIVKVIINVIVKAITAPFSLLASAFGGGGGDELSIVGFPSGSAQLSPEAKAGLDKVAKALQDRPALKLTVVGTSSVDAERDGFKRARLDELVRAEKRRSVVKDGGTATAVVSISPAEYPVLLKEVYKHADMSKPRNLVGMAKDLPVADMEKLLLADIKVNDDAMRELAVQRGVVVKDYLATKDLPPERLFLGASKAVPPEAKWTPRAELELASK